MLAISVGAGSEQAANTSTPAISCSARAERAGETAITWLAAPPEDRATVDRWCRAVGPPLLVAAPAQSAATDPPRLEDLAVMTWNAHLAEGDLAALIARLREGSLTNGSPVTRFVLLVQELFRRGADVPAFISENRSAYAIKARDPAAPDLRDHASTLRLAMFYVPAMRNGADILEDRGNAIVSTEPLVDPLAMELPLERQRRVAIGASVVVRAHGRTEPLRFVNVHLEPLSSPATLWIFRNPRRRQVAAVLELLRSPKFEVPRSSAGTVLGGDFNTIQGGPEEDAYAFARAWSHSLVNEDRRSTHYMGRIDYLFFRLDSGWRASTTRIDDKFGSDHHPVLGRFSTQ